MPCLVGRHAARAKKAVVVPVARRQQCLCKREQQGAGAGLQLFTGHCRTTCSGQRPRTSSGTCACSVASASVKLEDSTKRGRALLEGHAACAGVAYAPLDGVLLRHAVLHTHARLLAPPPRDAVALAIEHHVKVHACGARAIVRPEAPRQHQMAVIVR